MQPNKPIHHTMSIDKNKEFVFFHTQDLLCKLR